MSQIMITPYFSKDELSCNCCGGLALDRYFVLKLDALRRAYKKPMKVNSCCRCEKHNKAVGGSENSLHIYSEIKETKAIDISCTSSSERYKLIYFAMQNGFNGIGVYPSFVHLDTREGARYLWYGK